MSKYSHEIYLRDKEKIAARNKKWRENNPEKIKQNLIKTKAYRSERWKKLCESNPSIIEKNRIRAREWYSKNKEKAIKRITEWGRKNRDKIKKYSKERYYRSIKTRDSLRENIRISRLGPKGKARLILAEAVRNKKIFKPSICSKCNATNERIQGHHHDYEKPLEVMWVCGPCHGKIHSGFKR